MELIKTPEGLQLSAQGAGKLVVFAPSEHDNALILDKVAKAGYYYPLMALKYLHALSTGLAGKNNVFIPNTTILRLIVCNKSWPLCRVLPRQ